MSEVNEDTVSSSSDVNDNDNEELGSLSSSSSSSSGSGSESDSEDESTSDSDSGPTLGPNEQSLHPPDIQHSAVLTNLCFHPEKNLILLTDHDGKVELYGYSDEKTLSVGSVSFGDEAGHVLVRDMKYSHDGTRIYVARTDGKVGILNLNQAGTTLGGAGESITVGEGDVPINSLLVIDERTLGIGDDEGDVTIWDLRSPTKASKIQLNSTDFVSQMISDDEGRTLVVALSDGQLASIKLRGRRVETRSEPYDSFFNCLGVWKGGSKVGVGDSDGQILWFDWNNWGYHSDIYKAGSKAKGAASGTPINAMIPITDQIGILGLDDGTLRAHYFFPHTSLGIVGTHSSVKLPVEKLDVSWDGRLVGSVSHDQTVKFWNTTYFQGYSLPGTKPEDGGDEEDKKSKLVPKDKCRNHHLPSSNKQNRQDFFSDM